MSTSPRAILRVRRHYNQWVADQTLEDYALRFTARKARHMSISVVGKTALGATAFLALESIAAAVTLSYGFVNSVAAIFAVCALFFITGLPITYYSARYGLDIDLLTRGAGFGYIGSTFTSLIYATFTFIFFAIEAAILSSALYLLLGIPMAIGYLICAVAVIPIVVKGISAISKFQVGTQRFWLVLQILALLIVGVHEWQQFGAWQSYEPVQVNPTGEFSWVLFGAAASVLFALIAQIGEQVDYLRFLPEKTKQNRKQWWFWLILSGPGWVFIGIIKMLFGSFLAVLAVNEGIGYLSATDPTLMYQRAFAYVVQSDQAALLIAALMVIVSQMKINVTNAYAGSIAWSNFFSRLTHSHPGRVVWLVFNVALALLLMELGIHKVLESILSVFAFVAVSWLCCVSADLLINKPLGLSPKGIEFKRGHLYDINPVGVVSMCLATAAGVLCYLGLFGEGVRTLGHFISIAVSFVSVPFIAWLTGGRYYLARQSQPQAPSILLSGLHECAICLNEFESEDVLHCPAYGQTICSLCCSLDVRCLDQCRMPAQPSPAKWLRLVKRSPKLKPFVWLANGKTGQFFVGFTLVNALLASLLALVYRHMQLQHGSSIPLLGDALYTLFFVLMIVTGVVVWLFVLAHDSRLVAQQESNRQTRKLIDEIDAHKETDEQLQQAKELAERANAAKSRYLSGISHELRTPLQTILGYAQLLADKQDTPESHRHGLSTIHRSGQYLGDLIEGLLDVSKIEAGRLDLHIAPFSFPDLVQQVFDMFKMPAQEKQLALSLHIHDKLPELVNADEKRLRQVLINVLSNAIKYTESGSVALHVRYRSQVAEFEIIDTGVGIDASEQTRIFLPFERVLTLQQRHVPGTGLGLTIVKLLVEIMGGDVQLTSALGQGSRFKISLMLPWLHKAQAQQIQPDKIIGYLGERKTICLVDDDAVVRGLLTDLLSPLGFSVLESPNAEHCLQHYVEKQVAIDAFLLDVNMPGMNGFELAETLRQHANPAPIIMLSANAQVPKTTDATQRLYNHYLVKPVNNYVLFEALRESLALTWNTRAAEAMPPQLHAEQFIDLPQCASQAALESALQIGFKKGVDSALRELHDAEHLTDSEHQTLTGLAQQMQFETIAKRLRVKTT